MDIKFIGLEYGFCGLNIYDNNGECYECSFDELLSDPFPNFVRAYLKIKNHQNFAWRTVDGDGIEVWIEFVDEDRIKIRLEILGGYLETPAVIREVMEKDKFLSVLEVLFNDMMNCPDFPFQYPCHNMHDEKEYDRCDKIVDQYMLQYPDADDTEVDKRILRENIKLTDEIKEEADIYRKMLTEYIVPDNWCVSEIIEDPNRYFKYDKQ